MISMNEKQTSKTSSPKHASQTTRPTKKQKELLSFIESFIAEHGYSPSYSDLAKIVGVSKTRISQIVWNLEAKGIITKDGNKARTIQLQMKV